MTDFATPPDLSIPTGPRADDSQEPFKSQPIYSRPGRRAGMSVWGDGTVKADEGTMSSGVIPTTSPATPASGPVTFMKEGTNQKIHSRHAQMHDLVDLGGSIGITSVGGALSNGWLVENEVGGYSRTGEAATGATSEQQADPRPTPRAAHSSSSL
jgi:hypothetical protein